MIASLSGTVLASSGTTLVIQTGGVGFAVNVTPGHALASRVGESVTVHTVLVVREDELSLFGFPTAAELEVFALLRSVSGVGPKLALAILGVVGPDEIARAVAADDDAVFRAVSGVGPKTAKLITISLAGKLAVPATRAAQGRPAARVDADVLAALTGLGWPEKSAQSALEAARESLAEDEVESVPLLLRRALAALGPRA